MNTQVKVSKPKVTKTTVDYTTMADSELFAKVYGKEKVIRFNNTHGISVEVCNRFGFFTITLRLQKFGRDLEVEIGPLNPGFYWLCNEKKIHTNRGHC